MGFPVPNLNTNETATSGSRGEGGSLGSTAFNIGGINFGTNNQDPQLASVPAQYGNPVNPFASLNDSAYLVPVLIVGVGLAIWLLLRK